MSSHSLLPPSLYLLWRAPVDALQPTADVTVFVSADSRDLAYSRIGAVVSSIFPELSPNKMTDAVYNLADANDLLEQGCSANPIHRLYQTGRSNSRVESWVEQPIFAIPSHGLFNTHVAGSLCQPTCRSQEESPMKISLKAVQIAFTLAAASFVPSAVMATPNADICYGPNYSSTTCQGSNGCTNASNATIFSCPQAGNKTLPQLAADGWIVVQMIDEARSTNLTTGESIIAAQIVIQHP